MIGRVDVSAIAGWAGGQAFWAYDHIMAAIPGAIFMVPVHRVLGSLRELCALCPVPYETALAVIDQGQALEYEDVLGVELVEGVRWPMVVEAVGEGAWFVAPLRELRSRVYRHESGARLAVANEFVLRETLRRSYGQASAA